MESLHEQQEELENKLADVSLYEEQNKKQLKELLELQTQLNQQASTTEEEWLDQHEALEQLQTELEDQD
jgi:hypothetical protein